MPTPVACLLNSPVMTLSRVLKGASGARVLLNSMSAPAPWADQFLGLIPLPMNRAAKRRGRRPDTAAAGSSPQTGSDSSHGSAIATPAPRRSVRRLIFVLFRDIGDVQTSEFTSQFSESFVPLPVLPLQGNRSFWAMTQGDALGCIMSALQASKVSLYCSLSGSRRLFRNCLLPTIASIIASNL